MNKLDKLLKYQKKISDLEYTINILNWDLRVNTPKSAIDDLIKLITNYENQLFKLKTNKKYETLLVDLISSKDIKDLSIEEQKYIAKTR